MVFRQDSRGSAGAVISTCRSSQNLGGGPEGKTPKRFFLSEETYHPEKKIFISTPHLSLFILSNDSTISHFVLLYWDKEF